MNSYRSGSTILLLLSALACPGQSPIDSLRSIAADTSRPDSDRFLAHFNMVWEGYLFSLPDSAFTLALELQREARRKGNTGFQARASELLAATWYVRGDLRTALLHYDTALAIHTANEDREGMADVITNMASMRSYLGERDEALRLYDQGLLIHQEIHDSLSIANDLNAIGNVHMVRGDHAQAAELFNRSLRLQALLGNDRGIATGRINMGTLLVNQGDFEAAISHFQEALRIAEQLNDQYQVGKCLEEIGSCSEELGDATKAMQYYRRSLSVREALDDRRGMVNVLNHMGEMQVQRDQLDSAMVLFVRSSHIAQEEELPWGLANALVGQGRVMLAQNDPGGALDAARSASAAAEKSEDIAAQRDAAELEHAVYTKLGRWKEALDAHLWSVELNDSLLREENQRAVLRNEYRYSYQKQALADSVQQALVTQQERLANELLVTNERSRRNMALAVGSLLLLAVLGIWQRARLLKRTNTSILEAQAQLVESEKKREAAEVRTRIASDVHDQLGSDLTKLVMLSGDVKHLSETSTVEIQNVARDIERIAGEANRSLGDIVWAIDPHHDSLAGLTERVRAHCERMLRWSRVPHTIDCEHTGPDRTLDPATKRDIYLVLREALNNAIKYANATHISATLHTDAQQVYLQVADNGIGIAKDKANGHGHGLGNMRQRAARIGAKLTINGDNGTTVQLEVTLPS